MMRSSVRLGFAFELAMFLGQRTGGAVAYRAGGKGSTFAVYAG